MRCWDSLRHHEYGHRRLGCGPSSSEGPHRSADGLPGSAQAGIYTSTVNLDVASDPETTTALRVCSTLLRQVRIHYGRNQMVSWAGQVTVPAPPSSRIRRTGPGAYPVVPNGGIPTRAIVLIVLGVLILGGIFALLVRSRRPRRGPGPAVLSPPR